MTTLSTVAESFALKAHLSKKQLAKLTISLEVLINSIWFKNTHKIFKYDKSMPNYSVWCQFTQCHIWELPVNFFDNSNKIQRFLWVWMNKSRLYLYSGTSDKILDWKNKQTSVINYGIPATWFAGVCFSLFLSSCAFLFLALNIAAC